jgi:cytochrome c biogenesis protein
MLSAPILDPAAFKPYTFYLEELEKTFFTGLQVNKDPGVPLVWVGCSLMVVGFFLTFFHSHRRLMIRLWETRKGVQAAIAGRTNKNPIGLERELDQMALYLKDQLTQRGRQDD